MRSSAPGNVARAIVFLFLTGLSALAQRSDIEVRSPSAKLLDTAPGRTVTASVVVANRGGGNHEIIESLTLPPGCQRVAPTDLPFRLDAGGQTVRVLAVLIPSDMPAGRFELHYAARSRRDPSSSDSVAFAIQVTPVDNLELVVDPSPNLVIAGDVYRVKLRVTNRGNSRISAKLSSRSSHGFVLSTDATAFALAAGATREIVCSVKVGAAFAQHTRHAVTFDIAATSASGKSLAASQASVAEIVPRVSGSRDPFHYLPVQVRLMTLAETGHAPQFQAEISGAGSLDEAGKHRLDFLFRGPDIKNAGLFGERDEYGASYHGEHWDIDLGDRVFSLSPLTQKHSLGRGAGVKWHDENTSAGAFYMTTRFRRQATSELGAFVREDITPAFSLQANYLRKTGGDSATSETLRQNIVTLESHYRRGKLINMRLEAGVAASDGGGTDIAYRADIRGELPGRLSYAVEHAHAGPDFHGYYSGTDTTSITLAKVITPRLRAHASLSHYSDNPALNDIRSTVVNRENSWRIGADYELSKKTGLEIEWQHVNRTDILEPVAYSFSSEAVRFGVSHDFGKLMLRSFVDIGTLDNALTGESGPFQRYNAAVVWRPTARQTYTAFGSYGPSAFSGSSEQALGMGISGRWQMGEHLEANFSYARNQFDGLTGSQQDQAMASIRYGFEDKRSISLVGRWSHSASKSAGSNATDEAAVLVTYTIPFDQPVSRKRSIGILQGQVKSNGGGLARVVLQIGEQFAVTDDRGHFEFPNLKPGMCELKVVADSLGPRLAMSTPLPMKVSIRPAGTMRVELSATPACSVSVRVARFEFSERSPVSTNGAVRETGGEEGVAVELANGRDVWRAQTDRTGVASFDRLPGGEWNLRVVAGDLPALHTLEQGTQKLTLKPGEARKVALRVLPQRRTLRMLDSGTIR